jgi:TRAP-type C4-dicarboxylate transport system permease small subunit
MRQWADKPPHSVINYERSSKPGFGSDLGFRGASLVPKIARAMEKGIRATEKVFLIISICMILAMMFLGTGDVIGRYLFNNPIKGALEGSQLLMAGVSLLCWGYAQATKSHIRIDLLLSRYPARARAIMDLAGLALTIVVFGLITWQSLLIAIETLQQHRMLENLSLPLFPFKLMVPLGAFLLCLESIIQILHRYNETKREVISKM